MLPIDDETGYPKDFLTNQLYSPSSGKPIHRKDTLKDPDTGL